MKFLVFLSLLVFGYAQKGGTRQQLTAILKELSELKSGQQHLGDKLEEQLGSLKEMFAGELDGQLHYAQERIRDEIGFLKDEMNSGLEKLANKIESAQGKCEEQGVWNLGMNINPADGHIFGYTVGKQHFTISMFDCIRLWTFAPTRSAPSSAIDSDPDIGAGL